MVTKFCCYQSWLSFTLSFLKTLSFRIFQGFPSQHIFLQIIHGWIFAWLSGGAKFQFKFITIAYVLSDRSWGSSRIIYTSYCDLIWYFCLFLRGRFIQPGISLLSLPIEDDPDSTCMSPAFSQGGNQLWVFTMLHSCCHLIG